MNKLILFLALLTGISSCHTLSDLQIEKRRYRKGFYVHVRPHRYTEPVASVEPEPVVAAQQTSTLAEKTKTEIQTAYRSEKPVAQSAAPPVPAAPSPDNNPTRSSSHQEQIPMRRIDHQ